LTVRCAFACVVLSAISVPLQVRAQDVPPGDTAGQAAPEGTTLAHGRDVSWKELPGNLLSDQKNIWLFPAHLRHRTALISALAVAGVTAALVAADPKEAHYFRNTTAYNGFNRVFASKNTSLGIVLAPASFYALGLIRKDSKAQKTALFAAEAVVDAEILTTVMKDADRRLRPSAFPANGNFSDSWFEAGGNFLRGQGSFPSGHTIAAVAVATVVARRYGHEHRWVPYVAYGLATAVGFSRLTLSAHFLSDVFMGGALGYSISRFVVLRQ